MRFPGPIVAPRVEAVSAAGVAADGQGGRAVEVAAQKRRRDLVGAAAGVRAVAEEDRDRDLGALGGGEADEPGVGEERLGAVERAGLARDLDREQRVALAIVEAEP